MTVYCIAVTALAAFLSGFFTARLPAEKREAGHRKIKIEAAGIPELENFLSYNGEMQN